MITVSAEVEACKARLAAVGADLAERAIYSGLVYAASPVKSSMKQLVPRKSGGLAGALGHGRLSANQRARLGVPAGVAAILIGPRRGKGRLGNILEDGAKAHVIRPKAARALIFGRLFARKVQHPGVRARRFMARALEGSGQEVEARFFEGVARYLDRKAGAQ